MNFFFLMEVPIKRFQKAIINITFSVSTIALSIYPIHIRTAAAAMDVVSSTAVSQQVKTGAKLNNRTKPKKASGDLYAIEPAAGPGGAGGVSAGGAASMGAATSLAIGLGAAAVIGAVAMGAGGGGGGGSDSGGGNDGDDEDRRIRYAPPDISDYTAGPFNDEVLDTKGLTTINASAAYSRGFTGQGVTLGVMDTGVLTTHVDLDDQLLGCYRAESDEIGCDKIDVRFHGGHVAGIAIAEKNNIGMHGVAYDADFYNADIFRDGSTQPVGVTTDKQAKAMDWLVGNNVQVINNSYGFVGSYEDFSPTTVQALYGVGTNINTAYQNAINNDVIMVWSAGNSGRSDPNLQAALPLYFPQFSDLWVSTVAVSTNGGALSSYSNKCGDAAAFCIAAPGGQGGSFASGGDGGILSVSSTGDDRFAYAAGTSMAAPHVSGGLAVILEAFGPGTASNLTAEQVVDLMFATANKTGIYSDPTIYGQGLLDLDAATSPTAPLALASTGSYTMSAPSLTSTSLSFGPAFGDAATSAFGGLSVGAHDQYGRLFSVNLSSLTHNNSSATNGRKLLKRFGSDVTQTLTLNPNTTLEFTKVSSSGDALRTTAFRQSGQNGFDIQKLSFKTQVADGIAMDVHYGMNPGLKFGLQRDGSLDKSLLAADDQSVNPYMNLAGDKGISTAFEVDMNRNVSVQAMGFSSVKEKHDPLIQQDFVEQDEVMGATVQTSYASNNGLNLSAQVGMVQEDENILGTRGQGALSVGQGTPTVYTGVNASYDVQDKLKVIGGFQTGWTQPEIAQNSLFEDISNVRTSSFTLGLTGQNSLRQSDEWGLIVHQPMRVDAAKAEVSLPFGRGDNGEVLSDRQNVDLKPTGRELNVQAFYTTPIEGSFRQKHSRISGTGQSLSFGAGYRMEPGHNKDADPEAIGIMRYNVKF